jgi:hypothetical protein
MKTFYALDTGRGGSVHLFDSKKERDTYCIDEPLMMSINREHYDFLISPIHCRERGGAYRIFDHRKND